MKKLFLATTAFVVLAATSAGAADMTARPTYAAPPPVYTWTGAYVGGNVGYGWGDAKSDQTLNNTAFGLGTGGVQTSQSQKIDGVIGGVQAGYNYQFGTWVWGWETDFQGSGQKGGSTFNSARHRRHAHPSHGDDRSQA
jgi:outer membrane immunogenic protein